MSKKKKIRKQTKNPKEKNTKTVETQGKENAEANQEEPINIGKEILSTVLYMIFVMVVVWLIITFVGQRTVVDGYSMYDTLDDRESLWVNKLAYRFKDPERFDIVVFPHDDGSEEDVFYIKRVIGLPGERVRIDEEGTIYINDKELVEDCYGYATIQPNMIGRAYEDVVLGEDEYFVMGDNRNNSLDSRTEEVGNIPRDILIGKAVFRLWPLNRFGTIE